MLEYARMDTVYLHPLLNALIQQLNAKYFHDPTSLDETLTSIIKECASLANSTYQRPISRGKSYHRVLIRMFSSPSEEQLLAFNALWVL